MPTPARLLCALLFLVGACEQPRTRVLLVVDQDAGADHKGAIFRVDPQSKEVRLFARSELFRKPQDILQQPDGSFLVLDFGEDFQSGGIFRLSADGQTCEAVPIPPGLVDPFQFERAPDGSIWIVDKNANPTGALEGSKEKTGTLWQLSKDLETLRILATGPPLAAPAAIVFADGEAYLMDADAFRIEPFDLKNEEGGILRVRPHPEPPEVLVRFRSLVSPLGMHRRADGTFLVVDVNADPVERSRIRGAVYEVDPATGTTSLFVDHEEFRDPITCLEFEGGLLIVDPNADPLDLGDDGHKPGQAAGNGRGAIFRIDLATKAVTRFAASPDFISPIRVRVAEVPR